VNAIYVWGMAAVRGATVLLRIEDHDRIRSRPEFEAAILEDLAWLGFTPPDPPRVRQRDRAAVYEAALTRLRRTHHVYACDCSRRHLEDGRYPGRCRARGLADGPNRGLRVQMPDDCDAGDLLLRDRDGNWTYQFAVTVDDLEQGVTLVIRGDDLRPSTARQVRLAGMLGRTHPPEFVHHPLILKPDGEKLSKASGDTGIRELRLRGATAAEVIGSAAAAVGLITAPTPVGAADVPSLFKACSRP
jgi:glutamyl-tRNA synthetase/glutamyl-Q tRNA(Asp) synthetase